MVVGSVFFLVFFDIIVILFVQLIKLGEKIQWQWLPKAGSASQGLNRVSYLKMYLRHPPGISCPMELGRDCCPLTFTPTPFHPRNKSIHRSVALLWRKYSDLPVLVQELVVFYFAQIRPSDTSVFTNGKQKEVFQGWWQYMAVSALQVTSGWPCS